MQNYFRVLHQGLLRYTQPFLEHLRTKWQQLAPRERLIISIGGGVLLVVLAYEFVFSASALHVEQLKASVSSERELSEWMQSAVYTITQAREQGTYLLQDQSLISVVEQSVQNHEIRSSVAQIGLGTQDTVQVSYDAVPFNTLMIWLLDLNNQYGIHTDSISISRLDEPGMVRANLQLTR